MFIFQLMSAYFNDPEATKSVVDEDGFLNTGDIGHIDEDAFVRISDRQKNIIIGEDGYNVGNILEQILSFLKLHSFQSFIYGYSKKSSLEKNINNLH